MHSRFDTEARIAVAQATDIARELGHRQVGPDHLLLGLLANLRGPAAAALADHGVRLDAAREIVVAQHVDTEADRPADDDTHSDTDTDTESSGLEEDREALRAIGIDLDRVREAVRANLGADLTADWGGRPERGRGRGRDRRRGRRDRHDGHEGHGHGRGRRGPRSRRDDGPRFSASARAVLRDVRRSTLRARLDDDAAVRESAPGMTGPRLLRALLASDDTVVQAILAITEGLDGLRAQVEAATQPHPTA